MRGRVKSWATPFSVHAVAIDWWCHLLKMSKIYYSFDINGKKGHRHVTNIFGKEGFFNINTFISGILLENMKRHQGICQVRVITSHAGYEND